MFASTRRLVAWAWLALCLPGPVLAFDLVSPEPYTVYRVGYIHQSHDSGDVTGDGLPDVVVSMGYDPNDEISYQNYVFVAQPNGQFAPGKRLSGGVTIGNWTSVRILDLNGDAKNDIAIGYASHLRVYLADGHGGLLAPQATQCEGFRQSYRMDTADVDLDGDVDLIWDQRVYRNDGHGRFPQDCGHIFFVGDRYVPGDFNGDGYPDLFVPEKGSPSNYLFYNDGLGNFHQGPLVLPSAGYRTLNSVIGADVDRDGRTDLIYSFTGPGPGGVEGEWLEVQYQTAVGVFTLVTERKLGARADNLLFVDLDHDGWEDLVAVQPNAGSSGFVEYMSHGPAGFGPSKTSIGPSSWSLGVNPASVLDANHDGCNDIAITSLPMAFSIVYGVNCNAPAQADIALSTEPIANGLRMNAAHVAGTATANEPIVRINAKGLSTGFFWRLPANCIIAGQNATYGTDIDCLLPSLSPGQVASFDLGYVTKPTGRAGLSISARIETETPDYAPQNNFPTRTLVVLPRTIQPPLTQPTTQKPAVVTPVAAPKAPAAARPRRFVPRAEREP